MLDAVKQFFSDHLQSTAADTAEDDGHTINVAAAALLIEVGRADFEFSDDEEAKVAGLLQSHLQVTESEISEIVDLAKQESRDATSLHGFTRLVHDNYSHAEKCRLMEQLWSVALADGEIDKYEDYVLRKIAELIYLSHQDFIQAKWRAMEQG